MTEPIKLNRSAKAFSMRELQEWLTAVRDSQYDPCWLEALGEFWNDDDMVLVLSGQPLTDAVSKVGTSVGCNPAQMAALAVRRYLVQISLLGNLPHGTIPKIKTQLHGDAIWIWHRGYNMIETDPLRKDVRKYA